MFPETASCTHSLGFDFPHGTFLAPPEDDGVVLHLAAAGRNNCFPQT